MTRRHLISFAYVSCPCGSFCPRLWSNLYFCHSKNSQKNLINFLDHIFIKYVKNLPSLVQKELNNIHFPILFTTALYKGSAIYIFLIALGIFGHSFLSKSLPHYKIQLHLPSKSSSANFQSFCPPRSIVKEVPFYISKWHEIYTAPSYAQIINLLQIAAQSNHLCEPRFNLYFMAKLARCKASVI